MSVLRTSDYLFPALGKHALRSFHFKKAYHLFNITFSPPFLLFFFSASNMKQ